MTQVNAVSANFYRTAPDYGLPVKSDHSRSQYSSYVLQLPMKYQAPAITY